MGFFYQNLNERPRSRVGAWWSKAPTGLPIHGRASWYGQEDTRYQTRLRIEWHLWSLRCALGLKVEPFGEDNVQIHYGMPPLDLYLSASSPLMQKIAARLVRQPSDMGDTYSGRSIGLRVFDWAIWWNLWVDDGGWTNRRPKWRQGNFHVLDEIFGDYKHSERLLERRDIEIHMPEGVYRGVCELKEGCWKRTRWPFPRYVVRAHFDMHDPIPIPGKGENSYDCGQDATHGGTFPARSIAEAVGKVTGDVLATRERRAGRNWRPETRNDQPAA